MTMHHTARRLGVAATAGILLFQSAAVALPIGERGQVAIDVKFVEVGGLRGLGDFGVSLSGFADQNEKLAMGSGNGIGVAAGLSFAPPANSILPADAIASIEVAGLFQDFSKGKRGAEDSRQDGDLLILQVTPRITFGAKGTVQIALDLSPTHTRLVTDAHAPSGDRHRSTFNGFGMTIGANATILLQPLFGQPQSDLRPFLFLGGRAGPSFGKVKESSTYGVGGSDNRTVWLYNIFGGFGIQVAPNVSVGAQLDWLKLVNPADATINNSGGSSGRDIEALIASLRARFTF